MIIPLTFEKEILLTRDDIKWMITCYKLKTESLEEFKKIRDTLYQKFYELPPNSTIPLSFHYFEKFFPTLHKLYSKGLIRNITDYFEGREKPDHNTVVIEDSLLLSKTLPEKLLKDYITKCTVKAGRIARSGVELFEPGGSKKYQGFSNPFYFNDSPILPYYALFHGWDEKGSIAVKPVSKKEAERFDLTELKIF